MTDVGRNDGAARGALDLLAKRHHPRRTRTFAITLRLGLLFRPLLAPPIIFLIAALPVFAITHGRSLSLPSDRIIFEIAEDNNRQRIAGPVSRILLGTNQGAACRLTIEHKK